VENSSGWNSSDWIYFSYSSKNMTFLINHMLSVMTRVLILVVILIISTTTNAQVKKEFDNVSFETKTLHLTAKLRESDSPTSNVICEIPSNQSVKILSKQFDYYKVEYKGVVGFINELYFQGGSTSLHQNINSPNSITHASSINCDDIIHVKGSNFSSKPSIINRLGSCSKVYVPIPKAGEYQWGWFVSYLKETLGLQVVTVIDDFSNDVTQHGSIISVYREYKGESIYEKGNINDVWAILNYLEATSGYSTMRSAKITFVDLYNSYTWDYSIDVPVKADKYVNALEKNICSSVIRNQQNAVVAPKNMSCWTEASLRKEYGSNFTKPFEGIYESAFSAQSGAPKYKVAVKIISNKLHIVYLSGAINSADWQEGEIKAYLENTATENLFKTRWIMGDKTEDKGFYISFEQGVMNVLNSQGEKDVYIKLYPSPADNPSTSPKASTSGTGFAISSNGIIVTNYHVIEGAKTINVRGINGNFNKAYSTNILIVDKVNDLALIKIEDSGFSSLGNIPYVIKPNSSSVGENIFVLGYPLRAKMGDEIKLTNGIISSKTGYQGDITSYQISAPVQPGNSGGPLFDSKGDLIGVISAKLNGAENVSYGIKVSYLLNLIDSIDFPIVLQKTSSINNKQLTQQVATLNKFVYMIEVE
jgi:S1-C subfamily serine protease